MFVMFNCVLSHSQVVSQVVSIPGLCRLSYSYKNNIRGSNSMDPDQAWHFVGPGLGPNSLKSLSADITRKQQVRSCQSRVTALDVILC